MTEHFTMDNTQGYDQDDLDALNQEITAFLADYEPYTPEWYEAAKDAVGD